MRQVRLMMGMPITVEIADETARATDIDVVFEYFHAIDKTFSTYKRRSEISLINRGKISQKDYSAEMKTVLRLAEKTKRETDGFFDIGPVERMRLEDLRSFPAETSQGLFPRKMDPSGVVKGWAIKNAADIIKKRGFKNYYVEAGGDIQMRGKSLRGEAWRVGIRNPFKIGEIVKTLQLTNLGVATSGTYERGTHIYNPKNRFKPAHEIVSLTVIGPNICEADRFATAAFAMGEKGIDFIEKLSGFEGYMIDKNGIATLTSGFSKYVTP